MSSRDAGHFIRSVVAARLILHCGNGTLPDGATGVFGGVGPFDFSSVTATKTAIPIKVKKDNAAVISDTIDLTAAVTLSAVTVEELVTALTAAGITGVVFSKDATTGRVKAVAAGIKYLQIYDKAAELGGFGLGFGAKIIKTDSLVSLSINPVKVDDKKIETEDANDNKTTVTIPGYVQGCSGALTDTVYDYEMKQAFSGGVIDENGVYGWPVKGSKRPYFMIEKYSEIYSKGENLKEDLVGYHVAVVRKAFGSSEGENTYQSDLLKPVFNYTATNYKDAEGTEMSAVDEYDITVSEFNALDIMNV